MLFGIGSNVKDVVKYSVNSALKDDVQNQTFLDFDKKLNKSNFIKEMFYSLGWNNPEQNGWWDIFDWDRSVKIGRVKSETREVLTEKKLERRSEIIQKTSHLLDLKYAFPFFKKQELAALQTPNHPLRYADISTWESAKKARHSICSDPRSWEAVMNLSKNDIDRFSTLIRDGVSSPSALSADDRQILIHIGNLYRDLGQDLELVPARVRNLLLSCHASNMILFAIERKIEENRPLFEELQNSSLLEELNKKARGAMEKCEMVIGKIQVLKELFRVDLDNQLLVGRHIKIVKHLPKGEITVSISSMKSLLTELSKLSGQPTEFNKLGWFNRAVQAALLPKAFDGVMEGERPLGIKGLMTFLTTNSELNGFISNKKKNWATEIHDFGKGEIRIDHTATAQIEKDLDGIKVGECETRFSYSLNLNGISKLDVHGTKFEWDPTKDLPFVSLSKWGDFKGACKNEAHAQNRWIMVDDSNTSDSDIGI